MRNIVAGRARVIVARSAAEGGQIAADMVAEQLRAQVAEAGKAAAIVATGNSHLAFHAALRARNDIPWDAVAIFHMDEYVGIAADHPASFRRYLQERIVDQVQPRAFYDMRGDAPDLDEELHRYAALLEADPPGLCVMGIGENGHLAFVEPPADFTPSVPIDVVRVSDASKRQEVGEGHFASVGDVPDRAITLTIPTLLAPKVILVVVPELRKAEAVRAAIEGPITPDCPASILRTTRGVTIVLDEESASLLH